MVVFIFFSSCFFLSVDNVFEIGKMVNVISVKLIVSISNIFNKVNLFIFIFF